MKLQKPIPDIADFLNPRGGIATELYATTKKAMWLSLVCEYWLSIKGDNMSNAMWDEPTFDLPKQFPNAERFNRAHKECGAWARYARRKGETPQPDASRWEWSVVFEYWRSGGLQRGIDALLDCLPAELREKALKEFRK